MEKASKVQTVVQGEASESDDEEVHVSSVRSPSLYPIRVQQNNPAYTAHVGRALVSASGQALMVAGEASESEEEEVNTSQHGSPELTPLKVDVQRSSSSDLMELPMLMSTRMVESRYNKPKYDTLLHRKLRESNWQLHDHMVEVGGQAYLSAARGLTSATAQLLKSHSIVQDVSHSMRLLTNDLFHLDNKIDIILSCKLLPDIAISNSISTEPADRHAS